MMDELQEVIKILENEIKILNNSCVHVNKLRDVVDAVWARKIAIYSMQELQRYKQIGTVKECREAREKQKAKKPIEDRHDNIRYTEVYRCPVCSNSFSGRGYAKYCYHCGQKLDWRDGV